MNAPDKIYLYREKPKDYFDEDWHESSASDVENIAYIREDVLLEWASEMENCSQLSAPLLVHELVKKINSL